MDYIRMWWPMQDYFGVPAARDHQAPFPEDYPCRGLLSFFRVFPDKDFSRFCDLFTDPQIRAGIFQVWLNRDYTLYAQATGRNDLTLTSWQPSDQMRLYVRQDIASLVWNYGVPPVRVEAVEDPTEGKYIRLPADLILDASSANPVQLNAPRSLAIAQDGSIYVADTRNHRILHLGEDGRVLHQWGSFADGLASPAGPSTLNEPWGIGIGPDGSVYVTDTWNHRIQKFTTTGEFVSTWGSYGLAESPEALYGPRGLAVDDIGRVYVADTGNKRIVVFTADGAYITQFGSGGLDPGLFDEPVGIAVDAEYRLYVTDTWNQRIQTFVLGAEGSYAPERQWDVFGWFGQSVDNKPFIAVGEVRHVFVTDPEGYRVMEFDSEGDLIRVWGELGESSSTFGLPAGIAVDGEGRVWVTDAGNNRILRFTLP